MVLNVVILRLVFVKGLTVKIMNVFLYQTKQTNNVFVGYVLTVRQQEILIIVVVTVNSTEIERTEILHMVTPPHFSTLSHHLRYYCQYHVNMMNW